MPVKPHSRKRPMRPTYFQMPEVAPGDCVLFDINPNWLEPQPGIVTKVHGNSVDILGFIERYGQLFFEAAIHRDDPQIEAFPDRFDGNENAVWELAPQTVRIYSLLTRVAELERRVAELSNGSPASPPHSSPVERSDVSEVVVPPETRVPVSA